MGAKLREARERLGVSVREISDSTKVSVSILEALEKDDISRVPAGVFGRAFLRSFAEAVGLDTEAVVAEFVAQFPLDSVKDGYPPAEKIEEAGSPGRRPSVTSITLNRRDTSALLSLAAVGVFSTVALVLYVGAPKRWIQPATARQTRANSSVRLEDEGRSSARTAPANDGAVSSQASAGQADPEVSPNPAVPDYAVDGGTPPAMPSSEDATPIAGRSAQPAKAASDASRANSSSLARSTGGQEEEAVTRGTEPLTAVLSVTQPSWVIATVDGEKVLNRLLEVGEQETLEARRTLVLTAGNGGAVRMMLNGKIARVIGPMGKTVTTRIDQSNFRDHLGRDARTETNHADTDIENVGFGVDDNRR